MEIVMFTTVIEEWAVACATHPGWRSAAIVCATTSMLLVGCSEAPEGRATCRHRFHIPRRSRSAPAVRPRDKAIATNQRT